ncbi:MAG TPA: flagellar hook-length control protein FliK [Pseudoduganella sp.]
MINLPAAPAATVPPATAAGLPPPAANGAAADAASAAANGTAPASGLAGALLDVAAAMTPPPFGALLDAMAGTAALDSMPDGSDEEGVAPAAADDKTAAAAAVATMLPAMGNLPLAGVPGATPDSVAAVAAALTAAPASKASASDSALLLRQQAQASALAARETGADAGAQAESAKVPQTPVATLLDARAAMLAAATRTAAAPAQPTGSPAAGNRSSASEALGAALNALQGQAADSTAAPLAAKDSASLLADSQRQPTDAGALPGFRSVLANVAAAQPGDALQLSGSPEQWQQPLRAALGDRLQLQLARNDERAVIRLEPPNMGSVEISVRHSGGSLQVNIAATHSEVVRQLNAIGDTVRQDLAQRQFGEVAVTVSSSNARSLADGGQQQRQPQSEQQRQPGRALDGEEAGATTFAMSDERE